MIDPSSRLRRAIHLNDLTLVRRIAKGSSSCLRNGDQDDRNNSSLHLAARLGFVEIVIFLVEAGHEDQGISKNSDGNTPLMEAVEVEQEDAAAYLAQMFTRCIDWKNQAGLDALMVASRVGLADLVSLFLNLHPSPADLLSAVDIDGNTALHYASGYGQLKCLRVLLTAGADPMVENNFRCTPAMGSRSKDASTHFLSLVREIEVRKLESREREKELNRRREGGVRVVSNSPSMGQATGGGEEEEDSETVFEQPPRAVSGNVDSGRQSPARMRRGDGWGAFGVANQSRTGSMDQ